LHQVRNAVIPMMQASSARNGPRPVDSPSDQNFSPSRALEAVGERWSLLIMRDALFHGTTRFADFQRHAEVEPDILAARLDGFVGAGLMELERDPRHPDQTEYLLTEMGRNLEPVVIALTTWGESWTEPQGPPVAIERAAPFIAHLVASHLDDADALPSPLLIEISLLGSFAVRIGGRSVEDLAIGSQRLLVFLALHNRAVARIAMAGTMWPEASEERAGVSLRSALSRLDTPTREAVLSASAGLSLVETVAVDLRAGQVLARRLLSTDAAPADADLDHAATALLSGDLLPDWYDDWVVAEAEDWRELRLSALCAQAEHLLAAGRLPEGMLAARAAMRGDPLRESAHGILMRIHLAEGNQSEALRVFERYSELLLDVLGIEPTSRLTELVAAIRRT
jgi:DNA-binding SARP family transcriptional activator/DNA-binding HxlR family transcriptional regulator